MSMKYDGPVKSGPHRLRPDIRKALPLTSLEVAILAKAGIQDTWNIRE
jgi:hypothetical protein